ncbi:MAG: hypothetical protein M1839_007978 [Geoglossum umbratile]|nr:MAG: hypothetical protein M1839_007978 [Geoglossum umbratile]
MSTPTPRRSLARPRPSLGNQNFSTASSPNLGASYSTRVPPLPTPNLGASTGVGGGALSVNAIIARKASLNALTSNSLSTIPDSGTSYGLNPSRDEAPASNGMVPTTPAKRSGGDGDIEVGDLVDVPGGMYGTVKFVGAVKGKKGVFAGVELSREWAARGKNGGDVDGVRYFATSVPNSGIFLPLNRASKRASPTISTESAPLTPTTPSLSTGGNATPPTPSISAFSKSLGPGRSHSPHFKPHPRPSLPRPESPLRKQQNMLPTPGRPSVGGRYAPSPTPGKFGASMRGGGDPGKKTGFNPNTPKQRLGGGASARSGSALGGRISFDEDGENTPIGMARTSDGSQGSIPEFNSTMRGAGGSVPGYAEQEVERLRKKLEERDKQLKEQAASLAEMENSLTELQSLLPGGGGIADRGGLEDADATQLRALLREKNDKIAMLTAEFDAHRADFRSTIDTLELASTETERVYERRVEELLQEIRELQDRSEDVESVAQQLKQLEELVQELEEGLEDARRGEAEARGEVEFLRGEVERGRSELRREREKAAAALKGAGAAVVDAGVGVSGSKEVEQRDDEIRGLKAIIHSLSRDAVPDNSSPNSDSNRRSSMRRNGSLSIKSGGNQPLEDALEKERQERERLEREIKDLQGLVERKSYREEELEREMDRLRKGIPMGQRASAGTLGSGSFSEKTFTQSKRSSGRDSKGTVISWRVPSPEAHRHGGLETMHEGDTNSSSDADGSVLWCEICETGGHDILTCTNVFGSQQTTSNGNGTTPSGSPSKPRRTGRDAVMEGLKGLSASPQHADAVVAPLSPGKKVAASTPPKAAMPNPNDMGPVPGKSSGVVDVNKWCALCERDGHESVDCPFEDAF